MGLITQTNFSIIIVIVVLIALLVSIYMKNYSVYKKSWIHTFITIVAELGILIAFIFYFASLESINQKDDIESKREISELNKLIYITIPEKIMQSSNTCPHFSNSLNNINNEKIEDEQQTHNRILLSNLIFSSWKRFLLFSSYIKKESNFEGYVNIFLKWGKNSTLKTQWENTKKTFDFKTIAFGDAIFNQESYSQIETLIV